MKVYGWNGYPKTAHGVMRCVIAAKSLAEVRRLTGATAAELKRSCCETGNIEEREQALGEPGVMFYRPLHSLERVWKR